MKDTNTKPFIIAIIICAVMLIAAVTVFAVTYERPVEYAKSGKVVECDLQADVVVVEDCQGNLWAFDGVEDWAVGDWAAMVMSDNGTPRVVYDDEIISVRYENW